MKASKQTWLANIANGKIKSNTEVVLATIIDQTDTGGVDLLKLRVLTGIQHQTLTACLSKLHDEGLIKIIDVVEFMDNYYSVYVFVADPVEQKQLAHDREKEKILNWLKQGIVKFAESSTPEFKLMLMKNHNAICNSTNSMIELNLFSDEVMDTN